MIVYLVRHAWAEDRDDQRWPDDGRRPLTAKGRRRFAEFVRLLRRGAFAPERILTSPLVRCVQTAEALAAELTPAPAVVERQELAPRSDLAGLIEATNRDSLESVAWVGHAPDVDDLAAALIGDGRAAIHFSKGSVAAIEFSRKVEAGRGELLWLVAAKAVGA